MRALSGGYGREGAFGRDWRPAAQCARAQRRPLYLPVTQLHGRDHCRGRFTGGLFRGAQAAMGFGGWRRHKRIGACGPLTGRLPSADRNKCGILKGGRNLHLFTKTLSAAGYTPLMGCEIKTLKQYFAAVWSLNHTQALTIQAFRAANPWPAARLGRRDKAAHFLARKVFS